MASSGLRPIDPLDRQIGRYNNDARYIQEVLYYCESRFRSQLEMMARFPDDLDVQQRMQGRLVQELEFALAHAAAAAAMHVNYEMPLLTQLLAADFYLKSNEDGTLTLSPQLRLQLDADLDSDHPAATVGRYALEWWTNPDEDAVDNLDHNNIPDCLEYHRRQRREEKKPQFEPDANPMSAAAADPTTIRSHAQSFKTIFESRRDLTLRRAAGFFMLSEAAVRKEDDLHVPPPSKKKKKMTAAEVRQRAVEASIHSMSLPPATRDLGVRLTAEEAMDVFLGPRGARDPCRTDELPQGRMRGIYSPDPTLNFPRESDTYSVMSQDRTEPAPLEPEDIPAHFRLPPLRTTGSSAPFPILSVPERPSSPPHAPQFRGGLTTNPLPQNTANWIRPPPRTPGELFAAGILIGSAGGSAAESPTNPRRRLLLPQDAALPLTSAGPSPEEPSLPPDSIISTSRAQEVIVDSIPRRRLVLSDVTIPPPYPASVEGSSGRVRLVLSDALQLQPLSSSSAVETPPRSRLVLSDAMQLLPPSSSSAVEAPPRSRLVLSDAMQLLPPSSSTAVEAPPRSRLVLSDGMLPPPPSTAVAAESSGRARVILSTDMLPPQSSGRPRLILSNEMLVPSTSHAASADPSRHTRLVLSDDMLPGLPRADLSAPSAHFYNILNPAPSNDNDFRMGGPPQLPEVLPNSHQSPMSARPTTFQPPNTSLECHSMSPGMIPSAPGTPPSYRDADESDEDSIASPDILPADIISSDDEDPLDAYDEDDVEDDQPDEFSSSEEDEDDDDDDAPVDRPRGPYTPESFSSIPNSFLT